MRRQLCRKRLLLCLTLISVVLLLAVLRPFPDSSRTGDPQQTDATPRNLPQILAKAEEDNTRRILRVESICRKYNLGIYKSSNASTSFKYPPTPQYSVFYFDNLNKIAYCPTYKAGSTTWLYNLLTLNGVKEESIRGKQISEVARASFPLIDGDDAEYKFPSFKRLLCVRHPFDRILSAYRDKLEDQNRAPQHGTKHFYKRWGSKIRNKYRDHGQLEPTFEEFVRYLLDTDLLLYADDHWIPYNAFCTPCLLRYDYIATVETLMQDQWFFIRSLGLPSWLSPNKQHTSSKQSSQVAKEYFSQLTKKQVNKLYDKFRLDFEMFDYSIQPYLDYTKP